MKNKTVAIVINTSWNIYNFRLGLLKALQEEGYEVVAIAPEDEYSSKFEKMGIKYCDIKMNNKGTNPIEEVQLIFSFYKLYKEIKPDIILHYTIKPNIYGSIAAWMLGIPVIANITGLGTVFLKDSISSKIAKVLYRVALQIPKKIFYQNPHDRELFIKLGLVKEEKTDLLPGSGIDIDKFKSKQNVDKKDNIVRFLFVARLLKDKGLEEFVKAAKQMSIALSVDEKKRVKFSILGAYYPGNPTAITKDEMKEWENEGVVEYLGVSNDVKSVICGYDCIVLPSYREGLSRVLLEAASMAKPIITTNVPGCKDVVDDGVNGYLCEVKDVDSLAKQMFKMFKLSNEERVEMGREGREKVLSEFDEKFVINKYLDALIEVDK
jgi:glycosyltransferase involved in cell wall biosynthesis